MKPLYIFTLMLVTIAGYSQQKDISSDLNLAVKQVQGLNMYTPGTSPSAYIKFNGISSQSQYTSDILDRRINMIYVDGDKLYSNAYVPIVLQQHQTNLATDNFYRWEKMYALPDASANQPQKR